MKIAIILITIFLLATTASAALTDGLVAYYPFDEGSGTVAADYSGNANNATLVNGPAWVSGKIGSGALDFDGQNALVDAGSAQTLNNLPAFSISVWVYGKGYGQSGQGYIINKSNLGNVGWRLSYLSSGNSLKFSVDYDSTDLTVQATNLSGTFYDWTHWAVTWGGSSNASDVHIYKNGEEVIYGIRTSAVGSRVNDSAQNMIIGNSANPRAFDGSIDDVRVYNRSLSSSEILGLYASAALLCHRL